MTMDTECCSGAVESNVCRIVASRRHGYQVMIKPGHSRDEMPGEFVCIEAAMRRAGIVNHALFAAMQQMAARVQEGTKKSAVGPCPA